MTLAAITMTAPEAASPVQMYRATYSPDDNKLRLYAASRLDQETYKKVHDAGFRWAPKQALFVAPAWTPGREDVLLSLAGEIEDEDSTLAERQEARAERFTGYSGKRASESAQALDEVERLAAMIPPGQPILVGHHSERRARRDAQRIENGMKRAVMLFERAEYWEERARSALLHAKYKERPDVRWRRIKKIEADLRKAEKTIAQSQKYLTMWRAESLDLNMAKLISSHDHISACFPLDTYPRPAEKSQYEGSRSLWSALDDDIITTEQAREIAIRCHERQIQHQQRWVNHYQNRLIYERAMLDESGGVVKPKILGVGGGVGIRGGFKGSLDATDDDSHSASSGSRATHDARHDIDAKASKDFKEASDYFTSRKVSESGSHTDNNADSRVDQLSAALNSAKQSYDQYTTNMTRSHEYAEMASRTESMSGQMSEDLSQQFAQYVMKHAPQDAEAILTNTSSPEIAERRRAMAWSFVQEQVQPGVDNAWRESRGDIGKGMESVPSGGGSQDIIADHQGHQAIIDQRTQDSNIRNDVKHQVDNMVTEYKGNIGDTQNSIHGEENIVDRQYSELKNNHKQEEIQQNNRYNEENKRQKLMPTPSEDALKQMVDDKKERLKGPL